MSMANQHILIGARMMGYTNEQGLIALRAYDDHCNQEVTLDPSSLSQHDYRGYAYGVWVYETELVQD